MKAVTLGLALSLISIFSAMAQDNVFETTRSQNEIKCGYAEWTPILFKDVETGAIKGMSKDIMDAIARKTGYSITWAENAGWGTLAEGLVTRRYDMICVTLGMITPRAKAIGFSRPVFYLPVYAVVRADDARFDKNLSELHKKETKIGILEGEGSALFAAERFPEASFVALPQTSDYAMLLEDVKAKKSDITFITADTYDSHSKKHPGIFKIANGGKPLSVAAVGFGLPQNDLAFKNLIDTALLELETEGELNRIMDVYDADRAIFLRPQPAYIVPTKK